MDFQQQSPLVGFDDSPADSFISTPGDNFSSLFPSGSATTPAPTTMDPSNMVTPTIDRLPSPPEEDDAKSPDAATPSGDKKTAKKRKSWGQVLPEPKTNLPPRKRAKTDDEKEQRRVERVLRNRRAAQSSRERKRLEVEALEQRNQELEKALLDAQKTNLLMFKQLQEMRQKSGLMTASNPLLDTLRNDTLALSQELFSSQDGYKAPTEATVNPSSLSPDSAEQALKQEPESEQATNSEALSAPSPDVTQCPAVSHVGGGEAERAPAVLATLDAGSFGLAPPIQSDFHFSFGDDPLCVPTAADADRYVLESSLLSSPGSSAVDDDYLAGNSPALFNIDDYLHQHNDDGGFASAELMAACDNGGSSGVAADHWLFDHKVADFETQVSSENPIQQPQSGASSFGCDDGGNAVGV